MPAHPSSAEVLLRAAARARGLRGRVIVVKLGGSAMEDPAATRGTLESVVALQTLGMRQVLVHGGGKPIDRAMAAAGIEPRKVAGRRYTDEKTLKIVLHVLQELNDAIVGQIRDLGGKATGFPTNPADPDYYPVWGERFVLHDAAGEPVDLGFVGRVSEIETLALEELDYGGIIPVLASYARTAGGKSLLNVNADTVASAVAGAVEAESCCFLTDTPGVLRDVKDPNSLIPQLTRAECERLVRDGVIAGGMVPKVEACFDALDAGAGRAVILDGRDPHALLREFCGEPAGTTIIP